MSATLSRREATLALARAFAAAGLDEPGADAAILVGEATGLSRVALLTDGDGPIGETTAATLAGFAARRLSHEPVFRIVGRRPFWGLDLVVTPAVLDPRPDTEAVVEAALDAMADRRSEPLRVLDLGTGSGAILCALLTEWPQATGVGLDVSLAACRVARANAIASGLGDRALVAAGDWAASVAGPFDVVVCNPPYIDTDIIAGLDPEVRDHDPRLALDGGADGLAAYRLLCPDLPRLLAPAGVAVFEVGWTQAKAVQALFAGAGLTDIRAQRDAGGHQRAIIGRRA